VTTHLHDTTTFIFFGELHGTFPILIVGSLNLQGQNNYKVSLLVIVWNWLGGWGGKFLGEKLDVMFQLFRIFIQAETL
jgi:hypothetical protein